MKPARAILTDFIATILVAMSFLGSSFASVGRSDFAETPAPSLASARPLLQISLATDKPTPTPYLTPTAKVGAGNLALQGETVPQARGNAPRNPCCTADLAGKRLTLSFVPATATDAAVLAAYMPKAHSDGSPIQASEFPASIPGYLIQVSAQLQLDGQIVAAGGNFTLGSELVGMIGHYDPAGSGWNDSTFAPHAGDYQAIVSDTQGINGAQLAAVQSRLAAVQSQLSSAPGTVTADQVSGDFAPSTSISSNCERGNGRLLKNHRQSLKIHRRE